MFEDFDEIETEDFNVFTNEEQNEIKKRNAIIEEKMDRYYADLTTEVLNYILSIKQEDKVIPIIEIISNFCFEKNLEPELVGDAISQNFYLKKLIELDNKFISENFEKLEDW